jgi:hypothetical protein
LVADEMRDKRTHEICRYLLYETFRKESL